MASLPYLFASCRFAQYLKCIVRDRVGGFKSRDEIQSFLNDWILSYVDGDPKNSPEFTKALKPLAEAKVIIEEIEDNPGYYTSRFFLKPHYQLGGLTTLFIIRSRQLSYFGNKNFMDIASSDIDEAKSNLGN